MLKRVWWILLSVLVVSSMLFAACAPEPVPTEAPAEPTEEAPPTEAPAEPPAEGVDCMGAEGSTVTLRFTRTGAA